MADPVIVLANPSLVTALGLSAKETFVNVRAHTVRSSQQPLLGRRYDEYALATVPDDALPQLPEGLPFRPGRTARDRRLVRLLALSLRGTPRLSVGKPPPLYLALPEHTTQVPLNAPELLNDVQQVCPGRFDPTQSIADWRGRAGGVLAIGAAVTAVAEGKADVILAGGADTFLDTWVLSKLDMQGRVKTEGAADSFVPGEGSGLVYVVRADRAASLGLAPLAVVSPAAEGFEAGHWGSKDPYVANGLSETLDRLFSAAQSPALVSNVYSTLNGESYWAKEWGVARLRHQTSFTSNAVLNHPAEFYGDLGAASGPVLAGIAAMGLQTQRSECVLVYGSSDYGARAALTLSTLPG